MQKLSFFSDYIQQKYGKKLYRIPIDLALGCPNRVNGFGDGCIFCAENGSRARHLARELNLPNQVASGIEFVQRRYNSQPPYIAYFQAFTGTNAPVEQLRKLYNEVLSSADFKVVIVATRPDCLPLESVEFLAELSKKYELWVELGVQTAVDSTLVTINRGHTFAQTIEAVKLLDSYNINTAAHLIIGLPNEGAKEFEYTAKEIAKLPFKAVKFHQLLVLKNTKLAQSYSENHNFVEPLNEYSYGENLRIMLSHLPEDMLLMRLTADADREQIIAPKWWMNKGQFLEFFKKEFSSPSLFPKQATADGSATLYHPKYKQHFHSLAGANSEAQQKFIAASNIENSLNSNKVVKVLDVGFGLGNNSVATLQMAAKLNKKVQITALEFDIRVIKAAMSLYNKESFEHHFLTSLTESQRFESPYGEVELIVDDARKSLKNMSENQQFDYIFLDGFSPDKNPELWSYDFLKLLLKHLTNEGQLLTYSSAYPVRGALLKAGAFVGETPPFGRKRGGTIAAKMLANSGIPLPEKEFNIIKLSTAGTPLRDKNLDATTEAITSYHTRLIERLRKRGVPKWYRNKI